jgi:hypothetical protein
MTMKLKLQHLMDATLIISQIIREERPMPQKGKYRLARMHPKLDKEFQTINTQRNDMIKAYNFHPMIPNPAFNQPRAEDPLAEANTDVPEMIEHVEFSVPVDKLDEFNKHWTEFAEQEIELDIEPIPLEQLCLPDDKNGSIEANELIVLGDLVKSE